jgi:hypothetical protein
VKKPSPIDAVIVARAFEVVLPPHERCLALTHNEHKDAARSLLPWATEEGLSWVSPVEHQKALMTDEVWILYWRPLGESTYTQQQKIAAATLPGLVQWLQDTGLTFGARHDA